MQLPPGPSRRFSCDVSRFIPCPFSSRRVLTGDCGHRGEPGCAVQTALDQGTLAPERWQSFQKLQREQAYAARKADSRLAREEKNHWKKIHKAARQGVRFQEGE